MNRSAFIFDLNRCVGCMACVAGCSIENGTLPALNWRVVSGHNLIRHPDLPLFHFSLACNHCEKAPCMDNCPALAYSRDPVTGAVIHHAEACIGCKYCTWACPYDAPKFNHHAGVVEKCDFCTHRIREYEIPACVEACPVDALGYETTREYHDQELVPGFVDRGLRPAIRLIPLKNNRDTQKVLNLDRDDQIASVVKLVKRPSSKVRLSQEWSLLVFSLLAALMSGGMMAHLTTGFPLRLNEFALAGAGGMLVSLLHLGKKGRAWRSLLNLQKSWLSREIFFFLVFVAAGIMQYFWPHPSLTFITSLAALALMGSIDWVYNLLDRKEPIKSHSAMVLMTGILFYAWFSGLFLLLLAAATVKIALYVFRKVFYMVKGEPWRPLLSLIRLSALTVAILSIYSDWSLSGWMVFIMILVGELTDRAEFYLEAGVTTPEGAHYQQMKNQPLEKKSR